MEQLIEERRNYIKWRMIKCAATDIGSYLNRLIEIHNLRKEFTAARPEFYQQLKKINEEDLRGAFFGYYCGRDGYMSVDPARTFDKERCMEKLSSISLDAIQRSIENLKEQHSAMEEIRDSLNVNDFED